MAVKLHRCSSMWVKIEGHPCWRVQKALDEQGVDYEVVTGPLRGHGRRVGRSRIERLMRRVGLRALAAQPRQG